MRNSNHSSKHIYPIIKCISIQEQASDKIYIQSIKFNSDNKPINYLYNIIYFIIIMAIYHDSRLYNHFQITLFVKYHYN